MGSCGSAVSNKQVLLCGLDNAGKTSFLYKYIFTKKTDDFKSQPTLGFNFEVVKEKDDYIGFWDLGGKDTIRSLWPSFYKNINIHGLVFMIDAGDDERLPEARMELHKLMNEEELRSAVLMVIFNQKDQEDETKDSDEQHQERKEALESKIGFDFIHPSIVKESKMFNIMNDRGKKIREDVKDWLLSQMEKSE